MSTVSVPTEGPNGKDRLFTWFSNPWVTALSLVFGALGVALTIYFYLASQKTRKLVYSINPVRTIVVKGGEASTLRVLYKDQEISGDITAIQVAIWNQGTESIRPENILSPVRIVLRPSVRILEAKVRKTSRNVIGVSMGSSHLTDGVVGFQWKILEHNDGAVVQLIFAGPIDTGVVVQGTIEGQPEISQIESSNTIESPAERTTIQSKSLENLTFILLLALPALATLFAVFVKTRRADVLQIRWFRRLMLGFYIYLLVDWLFTLYIWWLGAPGPPFGF